jgi:allophanate hydrolase
MAGAGMTVTVTGLLADYRAGRRRPSEVAAQLGARARASGAPVWISLVPEVELMARAAFLDRADLRLPLYGIPFAVKDNIDVASMATSAACPGFAYTPQRSARVVELLLEAGAMLVGKTNLDQFATGLVGTRSPYGAPSSVFDPARVSGGSSSGSAVAVARGQVAFALGTDTAGSGRIPAAFNGLVGVKPTRGLLSTRGMVPACASLDCVSIFSTDVMDAGAVLDVLAQPDPEDRWSRPSAGASTRPRRGIVGLPRPDQARPDEPALSQVWERVREQVSERWDGPAIDISALLEAAPLLYEVWVAERSADLGSVLEDQPQGLDLTVAAILASGAAVDGAAVFTATHQLAELRRRAERIWEQVDALILPTAPLHPTHADIAADPLGVNSRLGAFTNFTNLLDLAAVAVPAGLTEAGLPFGITLFGPAGEDRRLLELAAQWLGEPSAPLSESAEPTAGGYSIELAVVGAHMEGLALNDQLTSRGGRLIRRGLSAPAYRFFALAGSPARPGLVRVAEGGEAIALEIWRLAPAALGELLTLVPHPLGLGQVQIDDGRWIVGFVCDSSVAQSAVDITRSGGWRNHLAGLAAPGPAPVGAARNGHGDGLS